MRKNEIKPDFYTLYTITCTGTDKVYIGVCLWWKQRRCKHIYDLKLGHHANIGLQSDFNQFGIGSIFFDIVATYKSKNEALIIEKYYTDVIFCKNKDICYNILSGGGNVTEQMRERYQDKIRNNTDFRDKISAMMSERNKGRKCTEQTKEKMSKSAIGRKASEATKLLFSEQRRGAGNSKAKKVIDTRTGKVYGCAKEAAMETVFKYDSIRWQLDHPNVNKTTLRWLH